ncbi:TolC family outer membrane protein [uncultured Pseudomonas sp.]|uniref:TolC family outer membrane protein n=1 Tax=uncultured Pseudomonas sp. TaxID=114707 RepID=UPI0025F8DBD2|nr:TolC family outer membrane protein [uncultured Pseudomonas sp.]
MFSAQCGAVTIWLFSSYALATPTVDSAELMAVYREAALHNSEIAAARADFAAREEALPQARANLLPTLSVGSRIESTRLSRENPELSRTRSGTIVQANLRQPIFNAASWFELEAAKADTVQAAVELAMKEQALILKAAEVYFETLRPTDELAASIAEEAAFKLQRDQAQARLNGGMSSITDVLDAQSAYDAAIANRKLAQRKVEDAFEQLARLTGRSYSRIEGMEHDMPVNAPIPKDTQAWVNVALRQNLSLLASNHAVQNAEQNFSRSRAGHSPTVDAVLSWRRGDNDSFGYTNPSDFGLDGYGGTVEQGSVALELNLPLFNGGRTRSQVREAYDRLAQKEQEREGYRREVVLNARNFFRAVISDIEQINARRQTVLSSQESLKASRVGADIGTRNTVDVLNAQRQLFKAVRDYNNARYDFILNNLRLKQAAGLLAVEDLQALSDYLKADYEPQRDFLPPGLMSTSAAQTSVR